MSFINPLYLWTLLGLSIPIAIHLWSKKEGKTIKVGSIKNLKESDSKQSSSIKLNELLLLFLRLSFLALISCILAEPYFKQTIKNKSILYIVEPSLFLDSDYTTVLDSLKTESTLLLTEGLPSFNETVIDDTSKDTANYWQLASQMEQLKTDSIVVFCYGYSNGIKGMRPELNANINWVVLENKKPFKTLLSATKKKDTIRLVTLNSTAKSIRFSKENYETNNEALQFNTTKDSILVTLDSQQYIQSLKVENDLNILITDAKNSNTNTIYIKAAFQAISEHLNITTNIDETSEANEISKYDAIISPSEASLIETKKPQLIFKPDPYAKRLIEQGPKSNVFYLTTSLNTELSIKYHLAEQLLEFLDLNNDLDTASFNKTQRDQQEIQTKHTQIKTTSIQEKSIVGISHWLWLLALLILIFERSLAFYRKQ